MTRAQAITRWTDQWIDVITQRASTLVRLSPELRLRYGREELAEQLAEIRRLEGLGVRPEDRRLRQARDHVAALRRWMPHLTESR